MSKPLTKAGALKLVKRWACLENGFPRTDEGVDALADSLIAISGTDENAENLSQKIIDGCERCPTPIVMRRIYDRKIGAAADGKSVVECDLADIESQYARVR